ncbi:hypothetical protein [Geofilum rubicundum]|uniref:Uncharacterized protein n=1 Tax=Geofilum rubicundum JCM 15548 TaxID=1236989 RepID=A0A0E9M2I3_9BACT|nr:hypothetical protein [Geofilum rubicundum]GAO31340.1 hypothetical protein JCM15548_13691 [Geofilum rubicundum JCM 15548]
MKGKKLPNKNSGIFQNEEALSKPGVKLMKQKRSRKPSIYDEMDEYDDFDYRSDDDVNNLYDDDTIDNDEDYY